MESISLASFASFLVLSIFGAYLHYRKMVSTARHFGTLKDYLFADYPGRSASVGVALIGTAWVSATSGMAGVLDPMVLYSFLAEGKLHIASINMAALAVGSGYAFDSALNKGSIA